MNLTLTDSVVAVLALLWGGCVVLVLLIGVQEVRHASRKAQARARRRAEDARMREFADRIGVR